MIVNIHSYPKKVVTVVDNDLIGKKIIEEKKQLDLTSSFYKGEEKTTDEIILLCRDAHVIHFIGVESVAFGKERGWVEHVLTVANVPHAEVMLMHD